MDVVKAKKGVNGVQVQFKQLGHKSKSFTIRNMRLAEVYERSLFMFKMLSESPDGELQIIQYKIGQPEKEETENGEKKSD